MYDVLIDDGRGGLVAFYGSDDDLLLKGSFVVQKSSGRQFVAQQVAPNEWRVNERVRVDDPLGRVGNDVGVVRQMSGYPHLWEGFEQTPGGAVSSEPAPGGPGGIPAAVDRVSAQWATINPPGRV